MRLVTRRPLISRVLWQSAKNNVPSGPVRTRSYACDAELARGSRRTSRSRGPVQASARSPDSELDYDLQPVYTDHRWRMCARGMGPQSHSLPQLVIQSLCCRLYEVMTIAMVSPVRGTTPPSRRVFLAYRGVSRAVPYRSVRVCSVKPARRRDPLPVEPAET